MIAICMEIMSQLRSFSTAPIIMKSDIYDVTLILSFTRWRYRANSLLHRHSFPAVNVIDAAPRCGTKSSTEVKSFIYCHHAFDGIFYINNRPKMASLWCLSTFLQRDALVHSAVLRLHVVRLSVWRSVCPSVCDVGGSGSHRLDILKTNCTVN